MTFRTLLLIKALVCFVCGLYLLAAPGSLFGLLGGALSGAGLFAAREYGAAMMGTVMLAGFAQHVQARDARRAILFDLLVYDAIGVVVTIMVVTAGVLNPLGWGLVAVYAFFTVGSWYVLANEKAPQMASAV